MRRAEVINLERKQNESVFEHHKRLVYGKLVDKTLSDADYTELAELIYGQPYSSDVARRMLYGSRKTLELMEKEGVGLTSSEEVLSSLDEKIVNFKKEQQKYFDQRNAFSAIVRERSRQEELNEILQRTISSGNLKPLIYSPNIIPFSDNDLLVSLNDIHFGANINNAWCVYNSDICRQMMELYLNKILGIAEVHGSEKCYVVSAGDNISGNIHYSIAVTNKENVIEQVTGVSELISGFLSELSKHFKEVRYISVAGNHSRLSPNKENAVTAERLDDLIEWYLSARLQNHENVYIETSKLDSTMSLFEIRGKNYLLVHGDFDTSPGKIQSLQTMTQKNLYAVLSGHMHHNAVDDIQGIKTIMAGSFLGMDDYCVQKRIYGKPEQMVCVCDKDGVRCHYDISLQL